MAVKTPKKIIVTGGTGLLGSHLILELTKTENQIIALKRTRSNLTTIEKLFRWYFKKNENQFEKIQWVDGDITDIDSLLEVFTENSEIYHVAGKVSFNEKDKEQLHEINARGTANVVNAALEKRSHKLCHVSSIAAVGRSNNETLTHEEVPIENMARISPYALSKYAAEQEVWRGIAEGLKAVIVNPSIILGPGNWHDSSARLFCQVYKGLKFYTNGINGYVSADDLAKIMILLMKDPVASQRFIVSSENITYQQIFTWMAEAFNVKPPQYSAGPFASEITWRILKAASFFTGKPPLITKETAQTANSIYKYNNEKIVNQTGFQFKPVKETIEETARFFIQDLNGRI